MTSLPCLPPPARRRRLGAFLRGERGSMTIEFALWFPIFVAFICGATELGLIAARHARLEYGIDMAVRMVQLDTGTVITHDDLVQTICDSAAIIPDCTQNLMLEMRMQDMRDDVTTSSTATCIDHSEEVQPANVFTNGGENQLMVLRACLKFTPIFPTTGIAASLPLDGAGQFALISTGAYVQEPL